MRLLVTLVSLFPRPRDLWPAGALYLTMPLGRPPLQLVMQLIYRLANVFDGGGGEFETPIFLRACG